MARIMQASSPAILGKVFQQLDDGQGFLQGSIQFPYTIVCAAVL